MNRISAQRKHHRNMSITQTLNLDLKPLTHRGELPEPLGTATRSSCDRLLWLP
jgi:hypothetical protein